MRRLSLWTNAIARSVRAATRITPVHLTQLTLDSLRMIRCRRASRASCSDGDDLTLRRLLAFRSRRERQRKSQSVDRARPGSTVSVAFPSAIAGHSSFTASSICRRSRTRIRAWGSPGNAPIRRTTDRNALASRSTASSARVGSVPDLCCQKADEQPEEQAHRRQEPRRYRLERLARGGPSRAPSRRRRSQPQHDVQRRERRQGRAIRSRGRRAGSSAHGGTVREYVARCRRTPKVRGIVEAAAGWSEPAAAVLPSRPSPAAEIDGADAA